MYIIYIVDRNDFKLLYKEIYMSAVIHSVEKGSLAYKHKIKSGDIIEKINGRDVVDYLDYMYLSSNEEVEIQLSDRTVTIIK